MVKSLFITMLVLLGVGLVSAEMLPLVMWHGMGDTCCNPISLGALKKQIEKMVPGIYIYSIEIGNNQIEDEFNGFLKNSNDQIDEAFQKLNADPKLKNGFNAIGFSQGGQFLRAYVERYNSPKVNNLITMGGQHQGVFGFPRCPGANSTLCDITRKLLNLGAYAGFVQNHLVQAEYWKDPFNIKAYLKKNIFLPDINNELETKNATYKQNLMSLNKFVMVKFTEDSMVQPRESEWFGFYSEGQDKQIVALKDSPLYSEDWLGLKQMDSDGKLVFLACPGDHLQFTLDYFKDNIVQYIK